MTKAVFDSTILVSAFLAKNGISGELLHQAKDGAFVLCLSEDILEETQRVLLEYSRIRKRYRYTDQSVINYIKGLRIATHLITDIPEVNIVAEDPNDNMIIACALKVKAGYLISRDNHLLSLGKYQTTKLISPEEFIKKLREQEF